MQKNKEKMKNYIEIRNRLSYTKRRMIVWDINKNEMIVDKEDFMEENSNSCSSSSTCEKDNCSGCASAQKEKKSMIENANALSSIKKVIGVVSGKGGVGKSFVTASLACEMQKQGYKVGILDADITGPSIPKMFGVHGMTTGNQDGILPAVSKNGVKMMSINLLVEDEEAPVVWRGPVIAGAVKQFWTDVIWGELDYLFVDMPPGTGDVPLTVFQSLPVDGIVVVTSPQELVRMIVKKAFTMAEMMHVPVLGIIENFSYLQCPDCGKQIKLFGESHVEDVAKELNIPVLAKLPIIPDSAQAADEGRFYEADFGAFETARETLVELF